MNPPPDGQNFGTPFFGRFFRFFFGISKVCPLNRYSLRRLRFLAKKILKISLKNRRENG
jgi:hypothetical protein